MKVCHEFRQHMFVKPTDLALFARPAAQSMPGKGLADGLTWKIAAAISSQPRSSDTSTPSAARSREGEKFPTETRNLAVFPSGAENRPGIPNEIRNWNATRNGRAILRGTEIRDCAAVIAHSNQINKQERGGTFVNCELPSHARGTEKFTLLL